MRRSNGSLKNFLWIYHYMAYFWAPLIHWILLTSTLNIYLRTYTDIPTIIAMDPPDNFQNRSTPTNTRLQQTQVSEIILFKSILNDLKFFSYFGLYKAFWPAGPMLRPTFCYPLFIQIDWFILRMVGELLLRVY